MSFETSPSMPLSFDKNIFLLLLLFQLGSAIAIPIHSPPSSLATPQGSPTLAIILIAPNPSTTTVLESKPGYKNDALLFTVSPEYDHSDEDSGQDDGTITRGVITAIAVILVILILILIALSCVYATRSWALLLRFSRIRRNVPSSSSRSIFIPIPSPSRGNGRSSSAESDPSHVELPVYTPSDLPPYERGSPPLYLPQRPSPAYQSRVNHSPSAQRS